MLGKAPGRDEGRARFIHKPDLFCTACSVTSWLAYIWQAAMENRFGAIVVTNVVVDREIEVVESEIIGQRLAGPQPCSDQDWHGLWRNCSGPKSQVCPRASHTKQKTRQLQRSFLILQLDNKTDI